MTNRKRTPHQSTSTLMKVVAVGVTILGTLAAGYSPAAKVLLDVISNTLAQDQSPQGGTDEKPEYRSQKSHGRHPETLP